MPSGDDFRFEQIRHALEGSTHIDQDYYSAHRGLHGAMISLSTAVLAGSVAVLDKVQPLSESDFDFVVFGGWAALLA
jgi:hypothetical protein